MPHRGPATYDAQEEAEREAKRCYPQLAGSNVTAVRCTVEGGDAPSPADTSRDGDAGPSCVERQHSKAWALLVRHGSAGVFLDVRDSADAWVRVRVGAGELVVVAGGRWHRVVAEHTDGADCTVLRCGDDTVAARFDVAQRHLSDAADTNSEQTRGLVTELCRQFYDLGWVTGTGGSISIRCGARVFMAPSGVQKERMQSHHIYVLDSTGRKLYGPPADPGQTTAFKLSQCAPLFHHAYTLRDCGACIHSHHISCVLATLLDERATEFRITHQEMIKGVGGHGYLDELVVPIIENTPHERDLADSLKQAILAYPKSNAVLVRRHGVYIWGDTWEKAKTQAECFHYLFDAAVQLRGIGVDASKRALRDATSPSGAASGGAGGRAADAKASSCSCSGSTTVSDALSPMMGSRPRAVVLDIEGTTTPISFVHDVLFPYARSGVKEHLSATFSSKETQADIEALRKLASDDVASKAKGAVPITAPLSERGALIEQVVSSVEWLMSNDRKVKPLKQLQGHIWRAGYANGKLVGQVFDDVPAALARWNALGLKVYIYSSGSREAQRLLFAHTNAGDLRPHLSGYFDTSVGSKREAASYKDIALSLGVDDPSDVVFLTDVHAEATAARKAGLTALIAVRPGNAALPPSPGFPTLRSFDECFAVRPRL